METTEGLDFARVIIISMLLVVVFAIAIILFVLIYQRKLMRQKIEFQQLKLSQRKALLHNSFSVQEEERKKFAANLHDELGAQLSIAKMTLSSLENKNYVEASSTVIKNTLAMMTDLTASIRNISQDLFPPSLAHFGLKVATKEFFEKIPKESIATVFEDSGEDQLPQEVRLHLFRIIQESINNALKHAEASEIRISISFSETEATLIISDNGSGFAHDEFDYKSSGLLNMKSRAAIINYSLNINSGSNGTIISITPNNEKN